MEVEVAEQEHGEDRGTPDRQQHARESLPARLPKRRVRSNNGITRSLQTIVDTAIASTITMPVAADRPPMKATSASSGWSSATGSDSTKLSAFTLPGPKCSSPATAIGSTNTLISSMYSGNAHTARLRCRSLTFSTTITWNCRGRKITESIESTVSANHCS